MSREDPPPTNLIHCRSQTTPISHLKYSLSLSLLAASEWRMYLCEPFHRSIYCSNAIWLTSEWLTSETSKSVNKTDGLSLICVVGEKNIVWTPSFAVISVAVYQCVFGRSVQKPHTDNTNCGIIGRVCTHIKYTRRHRKIFLALATATLRATQITHVM